MIVRAEGAMAGRVPPYAKEIVAARRAGKVWLVCLPGRDPFRAICPQRATADEIRAQWPGADVEAIHE